MRIWDDVVTDEDRAIYSAGGLGQRAGLGDRPAVLVVDITYDFTGDRPESAIDSIARFPLSCGKSAWRALPVIRDLLGEARSLDVPVLYTRQAPRPTPLIAGGWAQKSSRVLEQSPESLKIGSEIPDIIAPAEGEIVIDKDKPSAFFGTPLESYLTALQIDTVVVTGTSTSGCVRATVIDAFSYNYRVIVVEDGVFDRSLTSHKVNLFDMNAKYADVLPAAEVRQALRAIRGVATVG